MEILTQFWHAFLGCVGAAHPLVLFAAIVFLPLAGMPVSPLLVAVGIRLGVVSGSALAFLAIAANCSLGYGLANRWLRAPLAAWLERRGYRLPKTGATDETLLILTLRLTPGVPLFFQNYLLGLANVNFARYLVLSLPIQTAWAMAFVWFGNSLAGSAPWRVVLALALMVGVAMGVLLLRRCLAARMLRGPTHAGTEEKEAA